VIGMIAATAYAFANSGADNLPVTIGTVPIQSSPSSAQSIGATVPYSFAELPLVECSTTFPNPGESPLSMPAMVNENVPTSLDEPSQRVQRMGGRHEDLGPRGWTCSALILQDGSSKLDVYPRVNVTLQRRICHAAREPPIRVSGS